MSFSVTGPFGPHNQHMGAPHGRARHAVTKLRIVVKPSPIGPYVGSTSPNAGARDAPAPASPRPPGPSDAESRPASTQPPASDLAPLQKSHVIWVPSLFLGLKKTLQFQRSDFKT